MDLPGKTELGVERDETVCEPACDTEDAVVVADEFEVREFHGGMDRFFRGEHFLDALPGMEDEILERGRGGVCGRLREEVGGGGGDGGGGGGGGSLRLF